MGSHANLPFHIYVNVSNRMLGPRMPEGSTPAIWHGIHSRPNQVLMCHLLLESGAHWSGMPIHGISMTESFDLPHEILSPWAAMGNELETFHVKYLEGLRCNTIKPINAVGRHTGIMVDWSDGFSRYPQEHKPLNLICLDSGQFALLPNNFVLYEDAHFVDTHARVNIKEYLRGDKIYWGS